MPSDGTISGRAESAQSIRAVELRAAGVGNERGRPGGARRAAHHRNVPEPQPFQYISRVAYGGVSRNVAIGAVCRRVWASSAGLSLRGIRYFNIRFLKQDSFLKKAVISKSATSGIRRWRCPWPPERCAPSCRAHRCRRSPRRGNRNTAARPWCRSCRTRTSHP